MKTGKIESTNPKAEDYENQTLESIIMKSINKIRIAQNMTQKELSIRSGIHQADISKFENGSRRPSLKLLQRLAHGIGMELKIELVHKDIKEKAENGRIIER